MSGRAMSGGGKNGGGMSGGGKNGGRKNSLMPEEKGAYHEEICNGSGCGDNQQPVYSV